MKRCLIIDDSSSIRKVARRILEGFSFQIAEVDTCERALKACSAQMPDCIIVDWRLPDQDSFAFISALRQMPGGDHPKVVYCTLESDPMQLALALRRGLDGYVMKPFDREAMTRSLQTAGVI
jgi:two-component system, chemotaxis family, chemotaxis protein CheY